MQPKDFYGHVTWLPKGDYSFNFLIKCVKEFLLTIAILDSGMAIKGPVTGLSLLNYVLEASSLACSFQKYPSPSTFAPNNIIRDRFTAQVSLIHQV